MKTVVITGSSKGIGLGLAKEFLKKDCAVVISARGQKKLDQEVANLGNEFGSDRVTGKTCDVTNVALIQQLWDISKEKFGNVDIWINNAGISNDTALLCELDPCQISAVVDTNLKGVILATQIALRGMLEQGSGQIYNLEGFGSDDTMFAGLSVYGSTKRAVRYFTESMAQEVEDEPVVIGSLSPGIVITDFILDDLRKMDSEKLESIKPVYNALADTVETVTPFLVENVLKNEENGKRFIWLTSDEANRRFEDEAYYSRDFFTERGL